MDILTHVFLPLIALYSIKKDFRPILILVALSGIFPDFDIFLGIHRSLFHSLLFIIPLTVILYSTEKFFRGKIEFSKIATFFLLSHIFLDFLSGGVPFLYPVIETGVGIEFPTKVGFGSSFYIEDFIPKIIFTSPEFVHGKSFDVFSGFGVAPLLIFFYYICREEEWENLNI